MMIHGLFASSVAAQFTLVRHSAEPAQARPAGSDGWAVSYAGTAWSMRASRSGHAWAGTQLRVTMDNLDGDTVTLLCGGTDSVSQTLPPTTV